MTTPKPPATEALLHALDQMALDTRASAVATGQNAAAIVRVMLPAIEAEAAAGLLTTELLAKAMRREGLDPDFYDPDREPMVVKNGTAHNLRLTLLALVTEVKP